MSDHDLYAHFWDHVSELRKTLIRMLLVIVVGVVFSFIFYEPIISLFTKPLSRIHASGFQEEHLEYFRIRNTTDSPKTYTLSSNTVQVLEKSSKVKQLSTEALLLPPGEEILLIRSNKQKDLIILGPLEGMLVSLKASVWVGIVATSPLWLWILLQFLLPGMSGKEKQLLFPFLMTSLTFISAGCLFAFYLTIPMANEYLYSFNNGIGTNMWSLAQYLDYTLFLLLANGMAFELCAIGIFAVHLGLISAKTLISYRRVAVVAAFVIGALLTPPDVLTQVMLAVPLIILYEGVIIYARMRNCYGLTCT